MLQLDDFSYCRAINTCYSTWMDLSFRNLFCCQRLLHIQMLVILVFNTRGL